MNSALTTQTKKSRYRDSLKSMDTEETFDLLFYRPLGYVQALAAKRMGITPNFITIVSIFVGIASGVCFYFQDLYINILGVILLVWADSLDSADGQLARLTGQYSRLGRILDGISSDIWFVSIYYFICLREVHTPGFFQDYKWTIWVFAAITGFFHGTQAAMADYYRQFHLFFLKGKTINELETSAPLWDTYRQLSWKNEFFRKLIMLFYVNYTVGQEKRTPMMQKLRMALKKRYGDEIPAAFREEFRKRSLPLMKYTNILSFNTRSFALFAAILIFQMPWLYFAFELTVLNLVLIYLMIRHERVCKYFLKQLQQKDC